MSAKSNSKADLTNISDEDIAVPFQYDVSSYGADFPVDMLVHRLDSDSLYIPSFQRNFVWSQTQASRFIESLLLGIPVPGIFLAKDSHDSRLLVVDGQQRLRTLQYFFKGVFPSKGKQFSLTGVQQEYLGLTYNDLPESEKLRLADCIIHATIVQQTAPSDDQSSVYYIFERINTNTTPLTPQEIRSCIYHGPFIDMIERMNEDQGWRSIFGRVNTRLRDRELILRFIALLYAEHHYQRPMRSFLNKYIGKNRFISARQQEEVESIFYECIQLIGQAVDRPFRISRAINAAVYDSVMVGLARRILSGSVPRVTTVADRYEQLLDMDEYLEAVERATSDEDSLHSRIDLAVDIFES